MTAVPFGINPFRLGGVGGAIPRRLSPIRWADAGIAMPGPLYDCYVLAPRRSAQIAVQFLDYFMPERRPLFDAKDPHEVLGVPEDSTDEEVLRFLASNPSHAYSMYWSNRRDGRPYQAIVSFTEDGCLILGLSPAYDDEEALALQTLEQLKRFSESSLGYVGFEEPPAVSREAFVSRADSELVQCEGA
jgi:hypothetical protein